MGINPVDFAASIVQQQQEGKTRATSESAESMKKAKEADEGLKKEKHRESSVDDVSEDKAVRRVENHEDDFSRQQRRRRRQQDEESEKTAYFKDPSLGSKIDISS